MDRPISSAGTSAPRQRVAGAERGPGAILRAAGAGLLSWALGVGLPGLVAAPAAADGIVIAQTAAPAATPAAPPAAQPAAPAAQPAAPADPFVSETRQSVAVDGERIDYVARTGTLTVPADEKADGVDRARIFYVFYSRAKPGPGPRPLTFVFNGGPGAAAAYLHLGLMGPRRLDFAKDGQVPDDPQVVDNAQTWLLFSDLVFVDPVGTGFSRPVGAEPAMAVGEGGDGGPAERRGRRNGSAGDASSFWETDKDLDVLAAFIRLFLSRNDRWLSPVVLAGESYGGFRVAVLADRLQSSFGISAGGVVMISPALELGLLSEDRFRLMPWISRLPSYAAAARRHGRSEQAAAADDPETLARFERLVTDELLPALAAGPSLKAADREALFGRVAGYIGLPRDLVVRYGAKIPSDVFAAHLLETDGRVVSQYDASIAYPAPHPAASRYRDPRLARLSAAVTAAFNYEVRTRLGVRTDLPYEVLNRSISARWVWQEGRGWGGPPGASENLESALKTVPGLRALLVHGLYDLVTPYFASAYVANQLDLKPDLRARLTLRNYPGGHMFYSHAASRSAFYADARQFYRALTAPEP